MVHLLDGTWAAITVNNRPAFFEIPPITSPWTFIFKNDKLRYVVIRGGLYVLFVNGLNLYSGKSRKSPQEQVGSIIDSFIMNPHDFDLLREIDDPIKTLKEMGAPTSFINELGLKKTTKRTIKIRK